jgi:dinuclear metal center YbgI/SA1388 family protein
VTIVADVLESLDRVAPVAKAAGWDPVGLQLGDPQAAVTRVAVCHEVTGEVVERSVGESVDLLISYHPLLFRPTSRLVAGRSAEGRAWSLVASGIALGVVHTAFDVAAGGTADSLASALGLESVSGFGPAWGPDAVKFVVFVPADAADRVAGAMFEAGAGVIGNYTSCSFRSRGTGTFVGGEGTSPAVGDAGAAETVDEVRIEVVSPAARRDRVTAALVRSHPYEEPAFDVYERAGNAGMIGRVGSLPEPLSLAGLADRCALALGSAPRVAGDAAMPVERVAVVPGSGSGFAAEAGAAADVLITGDVAHHRARHALDRGLAIIDAGHAPTERPGVAALYAAVATHVPDAVDLTHLDPHPWKEPAQWRS